MSQIVSKDSKEKLATNMNRLQGNSKTSLATDVNGVLGNNKTTQVTKELELVLQAKQHFALAWVYDSMVC